MKRIWSWVSAQLNKRKLGLYVLIILASQLVLTVMLLYGLQHAVRFLTEIDAILADNQKVIFEHVTETCTPRTF